MNRARTAPTRLVRGLYRPPTRRLGSNPSGAFLRSLQKMDKDLELIWWPPFSIWVLYRVVHRAPTPSSDVLIKEFELIGPKGQPREPGGWLLDWLRHNDVCRMMNTPDPNRARRLYMQDLMKSDDEFEERKEKTEDEMADAFARDAHFCARGRNTIPINRPQRPELEFAPVKSGAKRIYSKKEFDGQAE